MKTFIYLLTDDREEYFYVGKADDPEKRLRRHIRNCFKSTSPKRRWIQHLLSLGEKPHVEAILEEIDIPDDHPYPPDIWGPIEEEWRLEFIKRAGDDRVLNDDRGGYGGSGPGESSHSNKLSDQEVYQIVEIYRETPMTYEEVGKLFGVSKSCIGHIIVGRTWPHLNLDLDFSNKPGHFDYRARVTMAVDAVLNEGLKPNEASARFDVKPKTVRNRIREWRRKGIID